MRTDRRSFLLGSASAVGLAAFGWPAPSLPTGPDPGIDAITAAVRSITDLITRQSLIGFDLVDAREVLQGGGLAGYGEATVRGPEGSGRARLAAELALKRMAVYGR